MALVVNTLAASATPATDMMAVLATSLLANGWVKETTRTYTASIMGTTAACDVYFSAATLNGSGTPGVVSSGIYTGCILSFEIDDTNARIRVRAYEKFDSSISSSVTTTGRTLTDATDSVDWTAHGLVQNEAIYFTNIVTTTGLTANLPNVYYVSATSFGANTFRVSATPGGAAIALAGGNGTADVTVLARNSKWGVWGGSTATQTPSVNGAVAGSAANGTSLGDSFHSHFQSASGTQQGAWVEIACGTAGFQYWIGSKADMLIFANNSGGTQNVCIAGQVNTRYQGDLGTTIGYASVFLYGSAQTAALSSGSWTYSSGTSGDAVNWRVSREPGISAAQLGLFSFHPSGNVIAGSSGTGTTAPLSPYGGAGVIHRYYSAAALAYPLWLHGYDTITGGQQSANGRSNHSLWNEFLVLMRPDMHNTTVAIVRGYFPNLGEQVTANSTTYTSLGMSGAGFVSTAAAINAFAVLVDGSQFS